MIFDMKAYAGLAVAALLIGTGAVGDHIVMNKKVARLQNQVEGFETVAKATKTVQPIVGKEIIKTVYVPKIKIVHDVETKYEKLQVAPFAGYAPTGFVYAHDSFIAGTDPNPALAADGSSSLFTYDQVFHTVTANYGSCEEDRVTLVSLQQWIRDYNDKILAATAAANAKMKEKK